MNGHDKVNIALDEIARMQKVIRESAEQQMFIISGIKDVLIQVQKDLEEAANAMGEMYPEPLDGEQLK